MNDKTHLDGRTQRQHANKQRVSEVMLDMILESGEMPELAEILQRSEISRRSFFRFFNSRASRITEISKLFFERVLRQFEFPVADSNRTLEETLDLFIEIKSQIDEYRMPFRKLTEEMRSSSEKIDEYLRKQRVFMSNYVGGLLLPHFEDQQQRDRMIDHVLFNTSWSSWAALRSDFGMSVPEARAFIKTQIMGVMAVYGLA
jgi:hypothetical protein